MSHTVLILTKINETIISDFKTAPVENKDWKSSSEINFSNNINKMQHNNNYNDYFKDENENEIEENKSKATEKNNLTEIYLSFLDIYEKCLPFVLEFYANVQNRPKRKIASTYKDGEIEVFGTLNISIIELLKSFFEILLLNSRNKAFGYRSANTITNNNNNNKEKENSVFILDDKLAAQLKALFDILISNNFFKVCLNDLLKYEMNNHLQILLKSIFISIVDYSGSEINSAAAFAVSEKETKINISQFLIAHLFSEIGLLDFIVFNTLDKTIQFENTKHVINSGFIPCLVEIADKINNAKNENYLMKEILDKSKIKLSVKII